MHTRKNESTPLKIGNVLYTTTSLNQVAAINAINGTTLWQYNPGTYKSGRPPNFGFLNRGLAYRRNNHEKCVYIPTCDAYLIVLDAKTGKNVTAFGDSGRIDLTKGWATRLTGGYTAVLRRRWFAETWWWWVPAFLTPGSIPHAAGRRKGV